MRPDAFSLDTAIVHGSPSDIATWPVSVGIAAATMAPGGAGGVSFEFDTAIPTTWDYHMEGWGNAATGDPGNVLYTVWACARIDGQWHAAAFIQMWTGRSSTGASIPSHWSDWAYAADRWGTELVNYRPMPGDVMGFFVSAGNGRDARAATSVRERSNVVLITLTANEASRTTYDALPPIVVVGPPATVPAPPLASNADVLAALALINQKLDAFGARPLPTYVGSLFGAKVTFTPQ